MTVKAYAVLCASGEVHETDDHCYLFLDREQARDEKAELSLELCAPHRVITLRGEVSL